ncbi:MAG: hypothetical protein H0T74_00690 [Rubrobacteraceae bacterium]|nr:hypothetical protein [Rubrobacteraceae bacterium]
MISANGLLKGSSPLAKADSLRGGSFKTLRSLLAETPGLPPGDGGTLAATAVAP